MCTLALLALFWKSLHSAGLSRAISFGCLNLHLSPRSQTPRSQSLHTPSPLMMESLFVYLHLWRWNENNCTPVQYEWDCDDNKYYSKYCRWRRVGYVALLNQDVLNWHNDDELGYLLHCRAYSMSCRWVVYEVAMNWNRLFKSNF